MASQTDPRVQRVPLSRELVLRAGVILADEGGIESLSMRRLGARRYSHQVPRDQVSAGDPPRLPSEVSRRDPSCGQLPSRSDLGKMI